MKKVYLSFPLQLYLYVLFITSWDYVERFIKVINDFDFFAR